MCGRESRYFHLMSQNVSVFKNTFHRHEHNMIKVTLLEYFSLKQCQHRSYELLVVEDDL